MSGSPDWKFPMKLPENRMLRGTAPRGRLPLPCSAELETGKDVKCFRQTQRVNEKKKIIALTRFSNDENLIV